MSTFMAGKIPIMIDSPDWHQAHYEVRTVVQIVDANGFYLTTMTLPQEDAEHAQRVAAELNAMMERQEREYITASEAKAVSRAMRKE